MDKDTTILDNIVKSRCGGRVERCHTMHHVGSYNNAAHSWGVAMLMYYIFPEDFPRLAIYCLSHDIGEGWIGDIPAPTLWAVPALKEIVDNLEGDLQEAAGCPREDDLALYETADFEKLKACDRLELYLWCREQKLMGNKFVDECLYTLAKYFTEHPMPEAADAVFWRLNKMPDEFFLPKQQGIIQKLVDNEKGS